MTLSGSGCVAGEGVHTMRTMLTLAKALFNILYIYIIQMFSRTINSFSCEDFKALFCF